MNHLIAEQRTDLIFVEKAINTSTGNLFKETALHIKRGDQDAAILSLTKIIDHPEPGSNDYLQAYQYLNQLISFSEKYFELYGVAFESRN